MIEKISSLTNNKKTFFRKKAISSKGSRSNFVDFLNNEKKIEEPSSEVNNIQLLISELNSSGEELKNAPSLKSFTHYKMIVEKIFKSLTRDIYQLKKITSIDKKNFTQKEFHLIKVVNVELNSLLSLISQEQKNNFSIAAKIVKIKGILLEHLT